MNRGFDLITALVMAAIIFTLTALVICSWPEQAPPEQRIVSTSDGPEIQKATRLALGIEK